MAFQLGIGNLSAVIACNIYLAKDAPRYILGRACNFSSLCEYLADDNGRRGGVDILWNRSRHSSDSCTRIQSHQRKAGGSYTRDGRERHPIQSRGASKHGGSCPRFCIYVVILHIPVDPHDLRIP